MRFLLLSFIFTITACKNTSQIPHTDNKTSNNELLTLGYKQLTLGKPDKAVSLYLQTLAENCNDMLNKSEKKMFSSRSQVETLYYLLQASAEQKNAIVIDNTCPEGFYLMAYAQFELGNLNQAEHYVKKAIAMSPMNSQYLSELAHIYQTLNNWPKALSSFNKAVEAARTYSPENIKNKELSRALRGVGFTLIELNRLDEAEEKYIECLTLDPNDEKSHNELQYIRSLKLNKKAAS